MPLPVLVVRLPTRFLSAVNGALIFLQKLQPGDGMNIIVKAKLTGNQSKRRWCHFSWAITLRNTCLRYNELKQVSIKYFQFRMKMCYLCFCLTISVFLSSFSFHDNKLTTKLYFRFYESYSMIIQFLFIKSKWWFIISEFWLIRSVFVFSSTF